MLELPLKNCKLVTQGSSIQLLLIDHNSKQEFYGNLGIYEIYFLKHVTNSVLSKIKAQEHSQIRQTDPIYQNLGDLVLVIDLQNKCIWFSKDNTLYCYVDITDIVVLNSFLESYCLCLPLLTTNVLKDTKTNVTENHESSGPQESNQDTQKVKVISENPELKSRLEEICNILITVDTKNIQDSYIQELQDLIQQYCNVKLNVSLQSLKNTLCTLIESIQKHLKDGTIFELTKHLDKYKICSPFLKDLKDETSKSEKIKKIVTAFFLKELTDIIVLSSEIDFGA